MCHLKLLIITDLYPDQFNAIGGIFVKHQVQELQKHYDVYVFATHMLDFKTEQVLSEASSKEYHHYSRLFRHLFLFNAIKYWFLVIPPLKKAIKRIKPDIIHVHDCRHVPELINLAPLLRKTMIPHYLTLHNIITHPDRINNVLLRRIYSILMPYAFNGWKHIFCVNKHLMKQVASCSQARNISVIGNAISSFSYTSDPIINEVASFMEGAKFKIISAGNLKASKGFDLLIEAISRISKEAKDIRLAIFGDGDQRIILNRLIIENGMQNKIRCFGSIENNLLRNMYSMFDAFILPSYSETFGIVYLEAMSAGIVAAGVRGQGIDGVIKHRENGILIDPKSRTSIETQINWLMEHPVEAKHIAEAGKASVESEYRMDQLCSRIRSVYEKR
ncbi:MAG: glycosyltransferase family 4 protein [Candidatus Cloacimonadaceae bacterium]|jgi:glycosyltransferase involved in cell wall biosynthesis|nr:glycosyltransferase family 4 protein [Candidatus Cloacimonadaceae bacterium]